MLLVLWSNNLWTWSAMDFPLYANLDLSLVWQALGAANRPAGLSIVVAVVVAEVLTDFGYSDIKIKWPNDIIHSKKILGGIDLK